MLCKIPDADLSQRLDNTICRYKGRAVLVKYGGANNVELYVPHTKKLIAVIEAQNDPDFDISSPPLGYVQLTPSRVGYVSRRAVRLYKQGLTNDVIMTIPMDKNFMGRYNVFSLPYENMINDVYPTLDRALELVKMKESDTETFTEIAVSRDIALRYRHNMQMTHVFFKGDEVGFIIKDSRTVITPSDEKGWIVSKHLSQLNWIVE